MKLELNGKQVLVLGLGDTGLSALRWLQRQGALLAAADTRTAPPGLSAVQRELPQVELHLGPFDAALLARQALIVASPGVPLADAAIQQALARGVPVLGDVELFARHKPAAARVIAITGANGKSTVTSLVGAMCRSVGLKTVVAGNIGLPVLDTLQGETPDVYVLELSSFQLETTASLAADAATVLNLSEDHMDRYADMAAYAAAKARIFHAGGVQVLNRQDRWSRAMALAGADVVTFGTDAPTDGQFGLLRDGAEAWLARGGQRLMPLSELRIAGLHNAANALAALALCRAIGLEYAPLVAALRAFGGLPHRVERVAEIDGVVYYDDSKGTNVGATCAALAGLAQKVVLIAGGDGKGQDFAPLAEPVARHARAVVLIGRDAGLLQQALQSARVPLCRAETLEAAVTQAQRLARPGDAVLLSPACASFDMFRNYRHRAEVFCAKVRALAQGAEEVR